MMNDYFQTVPKDQVRILHTAARKDDILEHSLGGYEVGTNCDFWLPGVVSRSRLFLKFL